MLEMFVSVLPIHENNNNDALNKLLGGQDAGRLLYAIQHDLFNNLLKSEKWDELDLYFSFLKDAISYCRDETELFPEVIEDDLVKAFENRQTVIEHELKKREKKNEPAN